MIKEAEHDRRLKENRQKEEMKAAQHRRKMEAHQQKHRQELEREDHQKMLELKERTQADIEMQSISRLELDKRMQDETERDCQHKRDLEMEEIKNLMKIKVAEAEARKAEAKAKEASSMAKAEEAKMRCAEIEAKVSTAKTKEKEVEHRSMLWKMYFNPETKMQEKQLIMEEIKRLTSNGQKVNKAPVVVKEIKAPKRKGDLVGARPWTTSRLPMS
jgi:hypothetical protein